MSKITNTLDVQGNQIKNYSNQLLIADPILDNFEGRMYTNSTTGTVRLYHSGNWQDLNPNKPVTTTVRAAGAATDVAVTTEKSVRDALESFEGGGLEFKGTNVSDSGEGSYGVHAVTNITLPSTGLTVGERRRYLLSDIESADQSLEIPNFDNWVQATAQEITEQGVIRQENIVFPHGSSPSSFIMYVTDSSTVTGKLVHSGTNAVVGSSLLERDVAGAGFGIMTLSLSGVVAGDTYHYEVTGVDAVGGRNLSKSPTDAEMYHVLGYTTDAEVGLEVGVGSGYFLNNKYNGTMHFSKDTIINADYVGSGFWTITSGNEASQGYANVSTFPVPGVAGVVYLSEEELQLYYWRDSEGRYVPIIPQPPSLNSGVVTYISGSTLPSACIYYELLNDDFALSTGVVGSEFHCNFSPTTACAFDVEAVVSGVTTTIGTINITTGGVGSFDGFSKHTLHAGDSIRINAPADSYTMADCFIRLMATRPYPKAT